MLRHVTRPKRQERETKDPFWWWEDVETRSILNEPTDEDTVPDEHPTFEPAPPIHAYA